MLFLLLLLLQLLLLLMLLLLLLLQLLLLLLLLLKLSHVCKHLLHLCLQFLLHGSVLNVRFSNICVCLNLDLDLFDWSFHRLLALMTLALALICDSHLLVFLALLTMTLASFSALMH